MINMQARSYGRYGEPSSTTLNVRFDSAHQIRYSSNVRRRRKRGKVSASVLKNSDHFRQKNMDLEVRSISGSSQKIKSKYSPYGRRCCSDSDDAVSSIETICPPPE